MTFEQIALIALLVALMAAYALDRWHVEIVALTGLAAAFLLGLVPADRVFTGFADPAVVTVIEILIIAQAIGRSRVVDDLARKVAGIGARRRGDGGPPLCHRRCDLDLHE